MKSKVKFLPLIFLVASFFGCDGQGAQVVKSPSGNLKVTFFTLDDGQAAYLVEFKEKVIIDTSLVSFHFVDASTIGHDLKVVKTKTSGFSETWEQPWGEQRLVENTYNEMIVSLAEKGGLKRKFDLIFRVYDDGLGFRYHFPKQDNLNEALIAEERTEFNLNGDHKVWWIPGDWDIYEHLYSETRLSQIDALAYRHHSNLAQTHIPANAVGTPVTMKTDDGLYLSFHEAGLMDYAALTLEVDHTNLVLTTNLVGSDNTAYKVRRKTPFSTPWRMIQVAEKAGDLIESRLILNLNEPNKLGDVSWLEPTKYVGIWWEMHIDKSTWGKAGGRHGATTENAKRYIDFAAENNIGAVLVEGWNTGWENWIGTQDREGIFDFVTPYPDYDLFGVAEYAREKGIKLIMHHETSSAVTTYENQLDTAYKLIENLSINAVKTGYVGTIIPQGEYHNGQFMVNHYQKVLEKAAKHKVAINSHETVMETGLRRSYPNFFASENLRGQEFNAWATDGGNPPNHLTIVPFTRMLAGPIDFTPGIFNIKLGKTRPNNQVNTTLAHQLALYVVIFSPLQMVADLPENYQGHPAFQFVRDVGIDWEQTRVLDSEIGQFITIARQERNTGKWFLGSITNHDERTVSLKLDFLKPGKKYIATIYSDAFDAHWDKNPTSYKIEQREVSNDTIIDLWLASGGGAAISFFEK